MNALAYGSIRMHRACRAISPRNSVRNAGSRLASGRYGWTCAELSRSHMQSISPVMTNASGLPSTAPMNTVVSSVFG